MYVASHNWCSIFVTVGRLTLHSGTLSLILKRGSLSRIVPRTKRFARIVKDNASSIIRAVCIVVPFTVLTLC